MKFKGRLIVAMIIVILAISTFVQFDRFNFYMRAQTNADISDINEKGEKLSTELLKNVQNEKILIVGTEINDSLIELKNNVTKTLDYMKKSYEEVGISQFNNMDYSSYSNVIFVVEDLYEIYEMTEYEDLLNKYSNVSDEEFDVIEKEEELKAKGRIDKLFNYVSNGGKVFFANALYEGEEFKNVSEKFGVKNIGISTNSKGIKFLENIMIKSKGMELNYKDDIENTSNEVELLETAKIYLTDVSDKPLLWSNDYGKGKIFYFNGTMLEEKRCRGLIAGIISLINETDIYPILNAKVNYIDDFPAPVPSGTADVIYDNYKMSIDKFYKEIWWPSILKIGKANDVKYTGVFITTYRDQVENLENSPIDLSKDDFKYYTRELIKSGGELGLHGFNHQPLILTEHKDNSLNYINWKSEKDIVDGIDILMKYAREELDKYKISAYVPPSNIVSDDGLKALKKGNSDFKVVSALYTGDTDGDAYIQEINATEDNIINLPRVTSGYDIDESQWDMMNIVNLNGYIAHFIHPDDVLDNERSDGRTWSQLEKAFDDLQSNITSLYPWIKGTTASEAASKVVRNSKTDVYFDKSDDYINIYCDNFTGEMEFILKTDKKVKKVENCNITKIDENTYLVKVNKSISKLIFEVNK